MPYHPAVGAVFKVKRAGGAGLIIQAQLQCRPVGSVKRQPQLGIRALTFEVFPSQGASRRNGLKRIIILCPARAAAQTWAEQ